MHPHARTIPSLRAVKFPQVLELDPNGSDRQRTRSGDIHYSEVFAHPCAREALIWFCSLLSNVVDLTNNIPTIIIILHFRDSVLYIRFCCDGAMKLL